MSAEEVKSLHSRCRLTLVERIEDCLRKLGDHFPGFEYQPVMSESGWGARISRDDLNLDRGRGAALYSRFEMLVSPLGTAPIIESLPPSDSTRFRTASGFVRSNRWRTSDKSSVQAMGVTL